MRIRGKRYGRCRPPAGIGGRGLSRDTLDIMSVIGLIMLMGLVMKNAILLVDFTNQARREGVDGSRLRLS